MGNRARKALLQSAAILASLGFAASAVAEDTTRTARAELANADGMNVGTVTLTEAVGGQGVVVDATLSDLPPGVHAIHVHAIGKCDPPDFKSAGGHYNPSNKEHGIENPKGMHAGDLPNFFVPESGDIHIQMFATLLRLDDKLFDEDGAAMVIHAEADDYRTDPSGDAGPRLACGVIKMK